MLVVNMAQHRTALGFLVIVAVQSMALGQVMMVSPMLAGMRRNPSPHMRVVPALYQPAAIISRPAYTETESTLRTEPKEPIDEQRLAARIKELEIQKHNIAQKQMDLDDKIAILDEQAINCHKQIEENQEILRKLEELERIHSAEQIRLERLIQQQRLVEYQERIEQERLARQRAAAEEWNNAQKERQKEINSDAVAEVGEPVDNISKDKHNIDSATPSSKPTTQQAGQLSSEVQIQRPVSRFQEMHNHDYPSHSTSLQVHEASRNPDITPSSSKNTENIQIMKRDGVMGPLPWKQESSSGNVTSQHQRKNFGSEAAGKKL